MAVDYELLRSLHRMHRQLADIDERIRKGPLKVKIATANQANFQEQLDEASERYKKNRLAFGEKQLHLNEREARVADMAARLNAADSNKEYQLLKDRIAADEQANSVLADEIFELLEKQDLIEAEVAQRKEALAKATAEQEKLTATVRGELDLLKEQRQRIADELAQSEKKLPQDVHENYFRRAATKKEDALSETDGRTCGNCHQTLTAQIMSTLMMKHAVFCQGCGALFYLKEGAGG